MDLIHNLGLGFSVALSLKNILYCFVGTLVGTLIGVLPGIGAFATIALLLPFTYGLEPTPALIMLAGIYYGAQYGCSTTSILINIPGEASGVITVLDGYQMARQGRAGEALLVSALGSFFAGCFATVLIAAFGPPLANVALKFGPPEYFSLMVLGLIASVVLARGSVIKAIGMVTLGLLFALVGTDVTSGTQRFTFGWVELFDGIDFVVIAMGVLGISELIINLEEAEENRVSFAKSTKGLGIWRLSRDDLRRAWPASVRGTVIGSALGILPGGGALISAFASYAVEKKVSKEPERFGNGAIEGVAGPESANNAGAQTSFIPMLSLGATVEHRHGIDDGGAHDPQHPARPPGDDQKPGSILGVNCEHVGGQLDARGTQPAADRCLDQAPHPQIPASFPRDSGRVLHRCLHGQQLELPRVAHGVFWRPRIRLR